MYDTKDLLTMVYWIAGLMLVLFIIDCLWYKPVQERSQTDRIIERLHKKNIVFYQTLPDFTADKGIVTVVDDNRILHGMILVITLQRLGCQLPILVCYAGDELSTMHRKMLESVPRVSVQAIGKKLDIPLESMRGTQLRAYSMIYAPFSQVLLVEPDVLFFRNPEYLFQDQDYKQTGALFWKDRKIQSYWDKKIYNWVRRLLPYRKGDNRILDKQAGNYQSRDLLLFDKTRHKKALEKLWVLTKEWETVYNYLPGDKESYWMACEIAKEPYTMVSKYPGVIGETHLDVLCGHSLYVDTMGNLLACNDSLFHNGDSRQVTDFTHYAFCEGGAEWNKVLGTTGGDKCLRGTEPIAVPRDLKELFNDFARIAHDIKEKLVQKDGAEYNSDSDLSE